MPDQNRPTLWQMLKRDIAALVKLNLLFILCSLPLLSIPAALRAMTKVNLRLIEGRKCDIIRDFLNTFRDDFFSSLADGLIMAVLALGFGYAAWFYQSMRIESNLIMIYLRYATVLPLLILYCMYCYLLTIRCKRELSLFAGLKDALFLTVICIRPTLLCLLLGGIFGAVIFLGVPYSTPFIFVGAISVWNYTVTYYTFPMVTTFL